MSISKLRSPISGLSLGDTEEEGVEETEAGVATDVFTAGSMRWSLGERFGGSDGGVAKEDERDWLTDEGDEDDEDEDRNEGLPGETEFRSSPDHE